MKSFGLFKYKKAILFSLLTALILSAVCSLAPLFRFAKAEKSNSETTLYLPSTDLEYMALNSPIDVYHDDSVTAIVHNGQLLVYLNGEYKPLTNFTSIKQVKKLNDKTLLVSDNGSVYTISLSELSKKTALIDNNSNVIGGNYFDVNEKYIVSAYGTDGTIYRKASNACVYVDKFALDGDKPIAINSKNQIFYVNDGIYTISAENPKDAPIKLSSAVPSKMIADEQNVYYLVSGSNKVFNLNISDQSVTELSATAEDYDLGNLSSPSGISFNGQNLLITDTSLSAVQEFEVKEDQIEFTGFAIANGKTAYNRIGKNSTDVERYGDTIAVLDDYKLSVISNKTQEKYAKENYVNYILGKDVDEGVQYFALGNGKILYSTTATAIKLINYEDTDAEAVVIEIPVTGALVDDISYQSGTFYILIHTSTSSIVYSLSETDQTATLNELLRQTNSSNYGNIAVDVYKNLFVSDENGVYKYSLDGEAYKRVSTANITGIKKLATDLGGKLYALTNEQIKTFDGASTKDVTPAPFVNGDKVKSFGLNFDKAEVSLIYSNREYLISSNALENYSLDKAQVGNDKFITTGKNASVDTLQFASVKSNANVYSVERKDNGFTFNNLIIAEDKYIYICDVSFDERLTLCALISNNGLVLVDKTQIEITSAVKTDAPEKAFITTNVNAYFYPIITKNAEYALTDGNVIRLAKLTQIKPITKINSLGKDFYYASLTANGKTYNAFIPVDFTTPVLSQSYEWETHTIEIVKSTTVYTDEALTNALITINDNTEVKVVSKNNGIAKIILNVDGQNVEAFISLDAIKTPQRRAIINVVIIFTVCACLAGTALYFVLKNKKK